MGKAGSHPGKQGPPPEPSQSSPALCRLGSWLAGPSGSEPPFEKGPVSQALTLNLRSKVAHVFIFST